ncbi:pyrroline-5-carboxylate reductase [Hathewaya proteolytica DSM 3090]|uniref:Pyrroline-5-carboxylate reductase n=1 Tax=Hathewaya proteolytica DSM 3090 TaxID=1121331 RepID=A0A1M6PY33_9CLOT|nr:NAD(P)-binding domain-containing protein [Hathewaya proteolytica]SHK12848.1 pyrroline-5-carboxylate reductase [Hathewaya proteolytica DSM 3090]
MEIGVIGVGIITSNILEGFLGHGHCEHSFHLSPRNKQRSQMLRDKYSSHITVEADNQAVLDKCELVILGTLPQNSEEILCELKFRSCHKVVSLIPILGLPKIKEIIGDTKILCDVVPLPFISKRLGPIVVYPSQDEIINLLEPLGTIVAVDTEKEISLLRSTTALMSPFYELLYSIVQWNVDNGLNEPAAKSYVTSFFQGLCHMAAATPEHGLKELAEEMTPGGLNHQAVQYLIENQGFQLWGQALDSILERVLNKAKK